MKNQESAVVFDEERAATYDQRTANLAPTRDTLYLLMRVILSELPAESRILCVGAGTGAEIIALAHAFPRWRFTVVEPAAAMLAVCRRQAEEQGITSRCAFHEGYLDMLPASDPFEAATCLLVSHFFVQPEARSAFFRQIAFRIRSNGILVSSDLCADMSMPTYQGLLTVWKRMLRTAGYPNEQIEQFCAAYGREAALLPAGEVEAILTAGGFHTPIQFYQNMLIRAWYSLRV